MGVHMIGTFFNQSQSFKDVMQNMFDFGKSFNFSNQMPGFDLNKFWELNKKNINSTSNLNKSINDDLTAIADKQASIAKENADSLTDAMKEMSQGQITPQRLLELQGQCYQESVAKNMKNAKELGEMYTKLHMKFLEACSNQIKKNMDGCCGGGSCTESHTSSNKKR
jgi:phasin family protein